MAICKYCSKTMTDSNTCIKRVVIQKGIEYIPVKFGDENDGYNLGETCSDCGVKKGEYHHIDCDEEKCPVCGDQLLSCYCFDGGIKIK